MNQLTKPTYIPNLYTQLIIIMNTNENNTNENNTNENNTNENNTNENNNNENNTNENNNGIFDNSSRLRIFVM